jgi:hypothetical protein
MYVKQQYSLIQFSPFIEKRGNSRQENINTKDVNGMDKEEKKNRQYPTNIILKNQIT